MDHFYTIDKPSTAEFKDRGSKFIAYAYPVQSVDEFKLHLNNLKKEHSKAVHHCFAYKIGITADQFRVNDDGEPSGTAGKQILGQIDSKKLTNVAVVVVRYFGGTLLGVPGLINAYKTASALALQTVPVVQKPVLISYQVDFDYTLLNEIMQIIKQCNCIISNQQINLFSSIQFGVPKNKEEEFVYRIKDIHNAELKKNLSKK